jgi:hypothetical protein
MFDVSLEPAEGFLGFPGSDLQRRKKHMRFLSLYKCPERNTPPTPEEMARMGKLIEDGMKSGKLIATEGCLPSAFGARVRIDDGKYTVSDGPFTEAKEVVGGFAIIEASSKEEAITYIREFLAVVGQGECEVRQVFEAPSVQPVGAEASELVAKHA